MDKSLILNRLKETKKFKTDTELANFLGISKSTLSNWYTRNSIDYDLLFSKCEQINIDWLITGRGLMFKNGENRITDATANCFNSQDPFQKLQRIPLYSLENSIGLAPILHNNNINKEKVIDYIAIPNIPLCDGGIYITGDSMHPLLKAGDIIVYKNVEVKRENIYFGEIYLLAVYIGKKETIKAIKFVYPSDLGDEYIKVVSQNNHYPSKDIQLSEVAAMGLVRASIRLYN